MLGLGVHHTGLRLQNMPPSPGFCDFSVNVQDSMRTALLSLLVPVSENKIWPGPPSHPGPALGKGPCGLSVCWTCGRQGRASLLLIWPSLTNIFCVIPSQELGQGRFRWSPSLQLCSQWWEGTCLWDDSSVPKRSELGDGVGGPWKGTLGRDPRSQRQWYRWQGQPGHDTVISSAD